MSHKISFNLLGKYGRLGNQMFQYAALFAASEKSGKTPCANISGTNLDTGFELTRVEDELMDGEGVIYQEPDFSFTDQLFSAAKMIDANIDIRGYFQSQKYFADYEMEIKDEFDFRPEIRECVHLLPTEPCVSLHIRRTDYLMMSKTHHNLPMEYYQEAMKEFNGYRPVVFSDDIEWCKENLSWLDKPVFISNDEFRDMFLMSMCNGHIMANSSFSWWASYLGGGKTVAPKTWFGPEGPQDWQDIYLDEWTLL